MRAVDATVVGGGIAGVSVAAELAQNGAEVALVEAERSLAFHTTGRSAAMYLRNYGNDVVRRLTIASGSYFSGRLFDHDAELWSPRPFMRVGWEAIADTLRAEADEARGLNPSTQFLSGDEARQVVPALSPNVGGAIYEPDAMDLDVAAIHQSYVRRLRALGGMVHIDSPVTQLARTEGCWTIRAGDSTFRSPVVINAAGAWGDQVAGLAGAPPLPVFPLRRTIGVASLPAGIDASRWPLIAFESDDGSMDGYCKPEGSGLLISPADETPDAPGDARADELDVALAIDRVNAWTTLDLRHVSATWAGLRTFTADRTPVAGFSNDTDKFFWMAGQGGYGIQMAPALARAAAALALGQQLPSDLIDAGLTPADLSASRPGLAGSLLSGH